MNLSLTVGLLVVFIALAALASWRDSRPASHKPRLIPWRIVLILSGAGALFVIVHLVNLAGFATGRNQPSS